MSDDLGADETGSADNEHGAEENVVGHNNEGLCCVTNGLFCIPEAYFTLLKSISLSSPYEKVVAKV
jgi:hypothetical protein